MKHRPVNDRARHVIHRISPAGLAAGDTILGDAAIVKQRDG